MHFQTVVVETIIFTLSKLNIGCEYLNDIDAFAPPVY